MRRCCLSAFRKTAVGMSQKLYGVAIPDVDARGQKMRNGAVNLVTRRTARWPLPIVGRVGQNLTVARRTHDVRQKSNDTNDQGNNSL